VGEERNKWVRYKQNKDVTVKVGCIYTHNALERVDQNAALGCHFFRFSVLVVGSQSRIKKVTQSTLKLIICKSFN